MIEHQKKEIATTIQKRFNKSAIIKIVKFTLLIIILYFVYLQFARNWNEVIAFKWSIHTGKLLLSILMHLITFLLFSKVWCFLISGFGYKVRLKHAFKISYIANLGRYIPGRIWPVFGMAYLARQLGINEEVSVTSWVMVQIFSIPSAFVVSFICIYFSPELLSGINNVYLGTGLYILAILMFILSVIIIVIPQKTLILFNLLLNRLKRPAISYSLNISDALIVYFGYFICWFSYGFSFWLFVTSITSNLNVPLLPLIGTFVIAYQLGYIAIFAPGGIGVRELTLTTILTPYLGPVSLGIAVAARLWNLITEIVAALLAWYIKLPSKSIKDSIKINQNKHDPLN